MLLSGCAETVSGTATWPGAVPEKALLDEADFPPGVQYGRIVDEPGSPTPPTGRVRCSRPKGCANVPTNVIKESAERGPGSAAKYAAAYDGARIVMTVLSWNLDLESLQAAANGARSSRPST